MRLPDDDEIYDVDQTYLGPPGYYIGRLRYRMIAVTPVFALLGFAFLVKTGIGFSLLSVALTVLVSLRLSQWVVDKTTHERPMSVLAATFWHELTATRVPTRGQHSRRSSAFRRRITSIGDAHALPLGRRRRWRSYANRKAAAYEGE
ncbi:hypothetical protein [Cellulomonas alba]|uniref:Sensor domain-containing protein n=1 Tax=Cellulomonas alba TaxID=3053467 RepID=A0ABT7SHZ7_9CELL|nr:hypothetical protein [Cellulomonas alba]MDM7855801.1 hypothetical protein [Cellulomonas alba]